LFFSEFIFNAKTIPKNLEIVLEVRKILKTSKIFRKIPKDRLRHEQSKKLFGAREKDFKAF
jgi:hypothetical protein